LAARPDRLGADDLGRGPGDWKVGPVLRRVLELVSDGDFLGTAQLLDSVDLTEAQAEAAATVESVRMLCAAGAEQVRLARELAAAARDHQRTADQVRDRVRALLDAHPWLGHAEPVGATASDQPSRGPVGRSRPERPAEPLAAGDVGTSKASAASVSGAERDSLGHGPARRPPDVLVAALGPFEVTVDGTRVIGWGGRRNRQLLQYLILHMDHPVHREVLMEALWPGHSYTSARNNLNVCLYGLRQAVQIGAQTGRFVLHRDGRYLLDPELKWQVDRTDFLSQIAKARSDGQARNTGHAIEGYEAAVRLWRGPLFENDPESDWFAGEQRSLHELYLQALDELADLYLANHNVRAAAGTAQRILEEDECRESAHRVLMRCYSRQHQQSLIARQFQLCVATLRREFSLSPTDETVRLFRALTATQAV
jgi:DNA-binding SARP family transcriptional activator